jgi:hypothetical protein
MARNLIDPNRLRERLKHYAQLGAGTSVERVQDLAHEITEVADSLRRLQEYVAALDAVLQQPPSPENLDNLTRYLAFAQVELYEQLLDHARELQAPLEKFLEDMEALLAKESA